MSDVLFWRYRINAVLLIDHQIDSADWKEWELIHLPGAIGGFLMMHLPLLAAILYGLGAVARQAPSGLWFSPLLSGGGLLAFGIYAYFLKQGRDECNPPLSKGPLRATFRISTAQLGLTLFLMAGGAAR